MAMFMIQSHVRTVRAYIILADYLWLIDVKRFHTMTELWPRVSFGSRLALRPCSPLLSDAGTLQRARSHGSFQPRFAKTSPDFGFPKPTSMLRARTPTAGVLWENTRAESRAAELERVLQADLAFQNQAQHVKGVPEIAKGDLLDSSLREEQFHKDFK